MRYPLAIMAPGIGIKSETFIRRHMVDLLPGKTVAVASTLSSRFAGGWTVDCPTLVQDSALQEWRDKHECPAESLADEQVQGKLIGDFFSQHKVEAALVEYLDWGIRWMDSVLPTGVRYYAHAHGYDISWRWRDESWRKAYKQLDKCDGVITMSQVSKDRIASCGVSREKIHVIPYGVQVPDRPIERVAGERVRCLAVGRMVSKKAPILLLDAFRRALELEPDLVLDYVGGGDLMPAVLHYIQAFGLEDKVVVHGIRDHDFVLSKMMEADLFVQHSVVDPVNGDEEGLPVAILEAMAHALPVLATRHAGIPEAVDEGRTGVLVDEGDVDRMAQKLALLARNESLRTQMGRAGWQTARDSFTWDKERRALLEVVGFGDHA